MASPTPPIQGGITDGLGTVTWDAISPPPRSGPASQMRSPSVMSDDNEIKLAKVSLEPHGTAELTADDLAANFIAVGTIKRSKASSSIFGYESVGNDVEALERSGVIYTSAQPFHLNPDWEALRIYVSKASKTTAQEKMLRRILLKVDSSPLVWEARSSASFEEKAEEQTGSESLFYIFNTLQSPAPDVTGVTERYSRIAMAELLESGYDLLTTPYEYQRRSAAYMVQKESKETYIIDPRLEKVQGPEGVYYYDRIAGKVSQEKTLYPSVKGGILAETMGYGKTLICLSVILATRGHLPRVLDDPNIQFTANRPHGEGARSLLDMTAVASARHCLPWRSNRYLGVANCRQACERYQDAYISFRDLGSTTRYSQRRLKKASQLIASCATLIIVPPNLVPHWLQEIEKHVAQGALKVLVISDMKTKIPCPKELAAYDIVLFSKTRFGKEVTVLHPVTPARNRALNSPGWADCEYSPLKSIYWLRVIVDEGDNFATRSNPTQSKQIFRLLHVERRWIVSGTPLKGLYGVEVPLGASDNGDDSSLLESRKSGVPDVETAALEQVKAMLTDFLSVKPWSNSGSDCANLSHYISESRCGPNSILRKTLQSLVVRHQSKDVNRQILLPPLSNKVVTLEPTWFDKLTANLFICLLTVNAVTSERTGRDYMFSDSNKTHLTTTINNLRQAGFWWVGIKESNVLNMIKSARDYIEAKGESLAPEDAHLLQETIKYGTMAIHCASWRACTQYNQLGIFVTKFPANARREWSLDRQEEYIEPMIIGLLQAVTVKEFVEAKHGSVESYNSLSGEGIRQRMKLTTAQAYTSTTKKGQSPANNQVLELLKDPPDPPTSMRNSKVPHEDDLNQLQAADSSDLDNGFHEAKIQATASAKLTYLIERVLEFHQKEKIIIFYEHHYFGEWIAWGLELVNVKFRLYGGAESGKKRNEGLLQFKEDGNIRVLIMDLKQASHGLHIACASRVFIMNPIWDPNTEGQAIKRAHRMSQTKPVFVETLVLKGTLEEKMLNRRKQMQASNEGMKWAENDPLADKTMSDIIKQERFLSLDGTGVKFAPFRKPLALFNPSNLASTPLPTSRTKLGVKSTSQRVRTQMIAMDEVRSPTRTPVPPRPTYTSDNTAGISFERPLFLSLSPSPSLKRRTSRPPPVFSLSSGKPKKQRFSFATIPDDPFVESPRSKSFKST
ncbi:hypothetical protein KEM54_003031 [Ascosphaera aggregata]|nr:hypothetical protein KEM54_003031 [Ascosphaera aggregata]